MNVVNGVIANGAVAGSFGDATLTASGGSMIRISNNTAMNDVAKNINLNDGILELGSGAGVTAPLTLSNRTIVLNGASGGTIQNLNTASSSANIITVNNGITTTASGAKTLTLGGTNVGQNTISGNITNGSGTIALTKADVGTWSLSGTGNTFTGAITLNSTTTSAGTLSYASAGGANPITFLQTTGSATLSYTGSGQTMSGAITANALSTGTITLDASGTGAINYSNTGSLGNAGGNNVRKLVLSGTNTGSNILAGQWVNNSGGGAATLTKNGAGTWVLSGGNAYTGLTTVNAGTLQFARMEALNNNVDTNWTAAKINVKSGATFAMNVDSAGTAGFTATKLNTLLTNISVANTAIQGLQAGATLGFDTSTATGGTFTQGNAIANSTGSGSFHGAIGLTKLGTGTLVLDKTNTYTGATLVSAGTLLVSGSLVSDVTVSDGATLAGGGTVDDLIMGGGSLLDIFLSVSVTPDSLAATNISFAATGFGIDNLRVNGSAVNWATVSDGIYTLITGTLNSTNLENFGSGNAYDIGGGRSAYFQEGSLQLVVEAIPEPQTALLGALGLLLLLRRRRD